MFVKVTAALCFGLVLSSFTAPAQAQSRQRGVDATRITSQDETGRTRTRIVVQRRSFLDAGTEVLPRSQSSTDYINPWGGSPLASTIEGTNAGGLRYPLPSRPSDLMGKNNPYPFE